MSPFQPEKVAIEAGRIMLDRIKALLNEKENFAFETTLSSRVFVNYIREAMENGYETIMLYLWLSSSDLAIERVKVRVAEGGHDIPIETIKRRYERGLENFFKLYKQEVDKWFFVNNAGTTYKEIAQGARNQETVFNKISWNEIKDKYEK